MSSDKISRPRGRKGLGAGIIILLIGVFWLLRKMDLYIPGWLFEWEMILIYIGLAIGINSRFQNNSSWILIAIGAFFLIDDLRFIPYEIREYFWPLLVIGIGLVILIKPKRRNKNHWNLDLNSSQGHYKQASPNDKIDSVAIFNGSKRNVFSKNFKGGDSVTVFGGTEINLLNADFEGTIELESVVVFGGLKLIIPPNWDVRNNIDCILGGVEDKRTSTIEVVPDDKVLVLTGVVIFGGLDIVSY